MAHCNRTVLCRDVSLQTACLMLPAKYSHLLAATGHWDCEFSFISKIDADVSVCVGVTFGGSVGWSRWKLPELDLLIHKVTKIFKKSKFMGNVN